jgi:hypothetical protein
MLSIHRTSAILFGRHDPRCRPNHHSSHHRRRRDWRVESLEGRTLLSHFDVTNLNDSGDGSLRQAVELSNKTTGPNEIDLTAGLSGTITLTSGELMIANQDVTIHGPGQGLLSVSGNGNSRVFEIASGVSASLSRMTITGGKDDNGGGIYNAGTLVLDGCAVRDNGASRLYGFVPGGGIYNVGTATINASTISGNLNTGIHNGSGTVTINASDISGNSGLYGSGGGIYNGSGTVTINASTISGNTGYVIGGGIYNGSGTVTINASTITGNRAWGGHGVPFSIPPAGGGGIYNSNGGTVTIDASTISGNSALDSAYPYGGGILNLGTMAIDASNISGNSATYGAGIYSSGFVYYDVDGQIIRIDYATMTISDSSISGNSGIGSHYGLVPSGSGIYNGGAGTMAIDTSTISGNLSARWGGGIYNSGTVTIDASTISGNWAVDGGGIYNAYGTTTLLMSIVAGNSAPEQGPDVGGGLTSKGHNLIGNTDGSSGWDLKTDLLNADPKLGPLQDNGGPTWTMALLPGSPAIDAGSNDSVPAGVQYDQRGPGFQRIVNGTVDIGAFEWQPYVSSFVASWGNQAALLQLAANGLRLLPAGRKTDLPWQDINKLAITLSTAEPLTPGDVTISSASHTAYGPVTLSGSGTDYTIMLTQPITVADRVTIKLNLGGMVAPAFELDVLPGDVNDDGIVNSQDMVLIRNAIQQTGDPLMIGWADIDGDGSVGRADYLAARKKLGSRLP